MDSYTFQLMGMEQTQTLFHYFYIFTYPSAISHMQQVIFLQK